MNKKKIIRTSTVAMSLDLLLKGQLAYLNKFYEVVVVSGDDDHLAEVRNREKVKAIAVPFQRQIAPIHDLISLVKLYKVLKKEKPYIIHSITPKAGLLSMIAGYFAGVPIRIHTFTGLIFPSKKGVTKFILIQMDRLLCFFATQIIPEGQGVKNDLIQFSITKKPLNILANGNVNGIDLDYFNPILFSDLERVKLKSELSISENDFVFVFVGRLVKDKGINELIAAFDSLQQDIKNIKLLLVGNFEPELDPLLKATVDIINTNTNIISVGFQSDVRPYFSISNALVFPSYREGFPNVVLQAGAMGLPSIVSDINGCNEIISNNKNGIIIPAKDQQAIYDAMKTILNPKVCQQLQSSSRTTIDANYKQEKVWDALLEEYRKFEK